MEETMFCPSCYWIRGENHRDCEWCRGYERGRLVARRARYRRLVVLSMLVLMMAAGSYELGRDSALALKPGPTPSPIPAHRRFKGPMPDDYVLRAGDTFTIRLKERHLDEIYYVSVNTNGYIIVPRAGEIYLHGSSWGTMKERLLSAIGKSLKLQNPSISLEMTDGTIDPSSVEARQSPPPTCDVPGDFRMTYGTAISIHLFGRLLEETYTAEVGQNGCVVLPRAGELYILGMPRKDLDSYFKEQFGRFMRNFELSTLVTRRGY